MTRKPRYLRTREAVEGLYVAPVKAEARKSLRSWSRKLSVEGLRQMTSQLEDIIVGARVEVVNSRTLALHFDVRGAEDPEAAERSLDTFHRGEVKVEKDVATGTVTWSIRGSDGPPRITW